MISRKKDDIQQKRERRKDRQAWPDPELKMRLVTFKRLFQDGMDQGPADLVRMFGLQALEEIGFVSADGTRVLSLAAAGFSYPDMNALIAEAAPEVLEELRRIYQNFEEDEACMTVGTDVEILSPIPCPLQDVICLGLNYTEHAEEAAAYSSDSFVSRDRYPVYFSKRAFRSPGDGADIPAYADLVDSLDYEAELAVIIGRDVKGISPEEVRDCVFGYTILNDISARNLQTRHTQWYLGKSLDGFTPMGPCIVTADEFAWPPRLRISSTVNGELRQDSTTDMLIFGLERIISELSAAMTLRAGTIISTGTPSGVGMGFDPPKFLHAGDVVTCRIEGIGSLTNRIVD